MKKVLCLVLFALFLQPISKAQGLEEKPDFLFYKGDTLLIPPYTLESYFYYNPQSDSLFGELGYRPKNSTRGFIAFWKLINDSLFLIEVQGESKKLDLSLIFHDIKSDIGVFADWYNDILPSSFGELIYNHPVFGTPVYQYEKDLFFNKGKLVEEKIFDNTKSKQSKYTKNLKNNELLSDFLRTNVDHSLLPATIDKAEVLVEIMSVTPLGRVDNVVIVQGYNEILDKEALRVVKSIPEWDIFYQHGEKLTITYTILVKFERIE